MPNVLLKHTTQKSVRRLELNVKSNREHHPIKIQTSESYIMYVVRYQPVCSFILHAPAKRIALISSKKLFLTHLYKYNLYVPTLYYPDENYKKYIKIFIYNTYE